MKSSSLQLFAMALIAGAGLAVGGSASAQGTFTPGVATTPTNCDAGVSGTTLDTKSCTVGAVTATMSAWGYTNATLNASAKTGFAQGRLADWNGSGFGAYTGSKENSATGQHAFDNLTSGCSSTTTTGLGGTVPLSTSGSGCGGSIEALFLDFGDSKVSLTNVGIGWNGGDADLMVWAYTGGANKAPGTAATAIMPGASAAGSTNYLTSTLATCSDSNPAVSGGAAKSTACTAATLQGWMLVNSLNMVNGVSTATGNTFYSSYFLITTYFGAATSTLNAGNDAFKLNSFTVGLCTQTLSGGTGGNGQLCGPSQNQTAVPEPGSLALAGLALAGVFFVRRRKA